MFECHSWLTEYEKCTVYKLSYKALKQLSINGTTSSKVDFAHRPPETPTHEFQVKGITLNTEYYTWLKILRVKVRIPSIFPRRTCWDPPPQPNIQHTSPCHIHAGTAFPVTLKRRNYICNGKHFIRRQTAPLLRWVRKRDGKKSVFRNMIGFVVSDSDQPTLIRVTNKPTFTSR